MTIASFVYRFSYPSPCSPVGLYTLERPINQCALHSQNALLFCFTEQHVSVRAPWACKMDESKTELSLPHRIITISTLHGSPDFTAENMAALSDRGQPGTITTISFYKSTLDEQWRLLELIPREGTMQASGWLPIMFSTVRMACTLLKWNTGGTLYRFVTRLIYEMMSIFEKLGVGGAVVHWLERWNPDWVIWVWALAGVRSC